MKEEFSMPGILWILLTLACLGFVLYGIKTAMVRAGWGESRRRKLFLTTITIVGMWTVLLLILSFNGFFADFTKLPPRPALALFLPLPLVLLFAFSKSGAALLRAVPAHWIIYMQSFRIAVELLLLVAFINGKLPVQMTFEGMNFDVITGLLALPVGYLVSKGKHYSGKLIIAYNIIGMLLLLNILVIAVISMPGPLRYFMNEPANTLVAQFPFILLPGILVPIAYSMHIFSFRQMLLKRPRATLNLGLTV